MPYALWMHVHAGLQFIYLELQTVRLYVIAFSAHWYVPDNNHGQWG